MMPLPLHPSGAGGGRSSRAQRGAFTGKCSVRNRDHRCTMRQITPVFCFFQFNALLQPTWGAYVTATATMGQADCVAEA